VIALAVFAACVIAWAILEARATSEDRVESGTLALPTGVVLLAVHVVAVAHHLLGARAVPVSACAGGVLLAAGIAARLWSIVTLGPQFVTALHGSTRITTGPYRFVRHPSELGLVLAAFGGALLLGSLPATLLAAALVPLSIARCRREDAALGL
jgi:protein-S-isoprenylcysteine O-methyltransferase Ste14